MAKKIVSRARKPRATDIALTPKMVQQARMEVIAQGAYERPYNRLVKRDPAKTIHSCRRIVTLLAHPYWGSADETEMMVARTEIHGLVADALAHVAFSIEGLWSQGEQS